MRRAIVSSGLAIGVLCLGPAFAAPALGAPADNITICHRTSAVDNPYVELTTSANAIVNAGHGNHTGPVFPATVGGAWGDVIPPFDYSGGRFPGLNWNAEGQAVVDGGCKVDITPVPPEPPATTTTTTSSTTTTTNPHEPTTTTTRPHGPTPTIPPHVVTTTSVPSPGATSPPTPTTSPLPPPPPPVDPPADQLETAPEEAVVIDPGGHMVVLGTLDASERVILKSELELAFTGSTIVVPALAIGTLLILTGAALLSIGARGRRSGT